MRNDLASSLPMASIACDQTSNLSRTTGNLVDWKSSLPEPTNRLATEEFSRMGSNKHRTNIVG